MIRETVILSYSEKEIRVKGMWDYYVDSKRLERLRSD